MDPEGEPQSRAPSCWGTVPEAWRAVACRGSWGRAAGATAGSVRCIQLGLQGLPAPRDCQPRGMVILRAALSAAVSVSCLLGASS